MAKQVYWLSDAEWRRIEAPEFAFRRDEKDPAANRASLRHRLRRLTRLKQTRYAQHGFFRV